MLADTKELVAAGKTNVIGGFVGSPLSFQSVSDVVVSHKLGGTNYIMVAAYSLIVLATIALGSSLIIWIPNFVLGSILLFSGIGLLITWVWDLRKKVPLGDYLVVLVILGDEATSKLILDYGEIVELEEGKKLFEQGEPGDALYFLFKGALNISIDLGNGDSLSVRTMRAGAVVGEMALFTGAARSATALAKEDCTLCKLSVKTYRNLQKDHPTQVGIFHTYIIQLMSDRLSRANREIVALSR